MLRIERCPPGQSGTPAAVEVLELVSPRTSAAGYTSVEHVFAALSRDGGNAVEIGGDSTARRFYVRVGGAHARRLVQAQISAAYPQTQARAASVDPALRGAEEQVMVSRLELREPEYLPLRIPRDTDVTGDRVAQADPLLGALAAFGAMPAGWRALAQLVLQPAPKDWARRHLRRTVEHALERERAERTQTSSGSSLGWGGVVLAGAFLAAVVVLPRLWVIYVAHGLLPLVLLSLPAVIGVGGLYILWIRLSGRPLYDLELVKEKLNRPAAHVELRLAVFAPAYASPAEVRARLEHLVSAYRAYDLERGNGLVARVLPVPEAADALCKPVPLGQSRGLATLSMRELAGLWHLVQAGDDVALVERTTARRFLPLPETVSEGARVGVAEDGVGQCVPVHLNATLLRRATLCWSPRRGRESPGCCDDCGCSW